MAPAYERAYVAVDPVIFTIADGHLRVALNVREEEPYKGLPELPGGMLLKGEDPNDTLQRKLKAVLDKNRISFTPFGTFASPGRDPRWRVVSMGYVALVPGGIDIDRGAWHNVLHLPKLAFDHNRIVKEARAYLADNVNSLAAVQLMPKEFPLNRLQRVYEVVFRKKYDNRNFRKKMVYDDVVVDTGKRMKEVSHRPPELYRFK